MTDQLNPVHVSIGRMTRNLGAEQPPLVDLARPDWQADAACIGQGPAMFYDDTISDAPPAVVALCGSCPVFAGCDAWADRWNERGTWAGISERQRYNRYRYRRRRHLKAAGQSGRTANREGPEADAMRELEWELNPPKDPKSRRDVLYRRERRRREAAELEAAEANG